MFDFDEELRKILGYDGVCDIVDIANDEMEKIDSSKIDKEFKRVYRREATKLLFKKVLKETIKQEDIDNYLKTLGYDFIKDIKVVDNLLFFKSDKPLTGSFFANELGILLDDVVRVPYYDDFCVYLIFPEFVNEKTGEFVPLDPEKEKRTRDIYINAYIF